MVTFCVFSWPKLLDMTLNLKNVLWVFLISVSPFFVSVITSLGMSLPLSFRFSFVSALCALVGCGIVFVRTPPTIMEFRTRDALRKKIEEEKNFQELRDREELELTAHNVLSTIAGLGFDAEIEKSIIVSVLDRSFAKRKSPEIIKMENFHENWNNLIFSCRGYSLLFANIAFVASFCIALLWFVIQVVSVLSEF